MESLRGMVSFVQTARCGSFARAADVLGVSAVAVSRNVARLEAQLNVRLFARTTRRLSLTAEGDALLAQCEAPLAALDTAFSHARGGAETATGTVRVTAVSPYVHGYLAPSLGAFHNRFPQVALEIECSEQVSDMVAGRFDVGIRVGPLEDAGFVARPIGPLALALCASPQFLARRGLPTDIAELAGRHGLALKPTGGAQTTPWWLQDEKNIVQLPVGGPLICNDFATLAAASAAGVGVAQLPLVAALPLLRTGALQVLHPHRSPRHLQLFLHYLDRQLPARVRVFVDFVLETARNHPDLALTPDRFAAAPLPQSSAC